MSSVPGRVQLDHPRRSPWESRLVVGSGSSTTRQSQAIALGVLGEPTCSRLRVEYNSTIPGDDRDSWGGLEVLG
ncbi:hypothetical protein [Prochlorothrix hollandica]|uniref:hypothetical protein n=1 Tax=Prochlorothrix hollandica TaxID=1223 RepID=UPI00334187CA